MNKLLLARPLVQLQEQLVTIININYLLCNAYGIRIISCCVYRRVKYNNNCRYVEISGLVQEEISEFEVKWSRNNLSKVE